VARASTPPPLPAGRTLSAPSRREEILRAAAELFALRGFHGVSIDDIGAAVGVSGPALYRHFPSKEAILAELLVGISEVLLDEARARVAAGGSPASVLAALVDWQVRFALDHPALITVHERDLASLPDDDRQQVRRLQRTYVELWVDVLGRALPHEDPARARAAVHAAIGLINSTPHSARLDRPAMAALLRDMALGALRASAGSS
jgi:AcrR family transcriptional regulator